MKMTTMARLPLLLVASLLLHSPSHALSSMTPNKPRGCAATPIDKQKIAVFGSGGYLGSYIFGFLQRASSLYGSGMGGIYSPRTLCATAVSSMAMNKMLGRHFALAYAGEQHVKLTDMESVDAISARLEGYGAVIIGTMYALEPRPVSGGSYESTPNSKTVEFYLDQPVREQTTVDDDYYDLSKHLELFDNTLQACSDANVRHVVVVETPQTATNADSFLTRLQDAKVPYTYISLNGASLTNYKNHVFYKGIQGDLSLSSSSSTTPSSTVPIYREDLAAVVCESLQSLPWEDSRILQLSSKGDWDGAIQEVKGRLDREWVGNQNFLTSKFYGIE